MWQQGGYNFLLVFILINCGITICSRSPKPEICRHVYISVYATVWCQTWFLSRTKAASGRERTGPKMSRLSWVRLTNHRLLWKYHPAFFTTHNLEFALCKTGLTVFLCCSAVTGEGFSPFWKKWHESFLMTVFSEELWKSLGWNPGTDCVFYSFPKKSSGKKCFILWKWTTKGKNISSIFVWTFLKDWLQKSFVHHFLWVWG